MQDLEKLKDGRDTIDGRGTTDGKGTIHGRGTIDGRGGNWVWCWSLSNGGQLEGVREDSG